ncbi:hypothetical protein EC957_002749, partial [Mortierella hygrophila]
HWTEEDWKRSSGQEEPRLARAVEASQPVRGSTYVTHMTLMRVLLPMEDGKCRS